ncbi:hypothetical protein BS17DRAFT_744206 [Gyrodon lividus]|nr:hypothetical protein BS17DRAFT_744206 [Gyrodon lividus]
MTVSRSGSAVSKHTPHDETPLLESLAPSIKLENSEETLLGVGHQKRKDRSSPDAQSGPQDAIANHTRKRVRTGDVYAMSSGGQSRLQRHATFWYPDADTVLAVEDVLYRLSSSRLKDQSELFSDLLSGEPNVTTLQEVEISRQGDETCYSIRCLAAKDFDVLLNMDRRPTEFHLKMPSFHQVAAILRAASLLKMDDYRAFAINHLESWWPTDVYRIPQNMRPHAVDTFILCRQCDVPQLLRPVFYELVRDQRGRLENTAVQGPNEQSDVTMDDAQPSLVECSLKLLSREDERLVFRARELFLIAWFDTTSRQPNRSCSQVGSGSKSGQCPSVRRKDIAWDAAVHKSGIFREFMYDPISGLRALAVLEWGNEDARWCNQCVEQMQQNWTEKTEKLWSQLDELLGFDGGEAAT